MLSLRNKKKLFLISIVSVLLSVFLLTNLNFYLSDFLISNLSYRNDLFLKNDNLKKKIISLEAEIKIRDTYIQENIKLKDILKYNELNKFETLVAELVIVSPFTFTSTGIINKGKKDGVTKGSLALVPQGLIGKVYEVSEEFSRIHFIYNPSFSVMVQIGESKAAGILKGNGVSSRILYVTNDKEINKGDKVLIASNSLENYPAIEIGKISEIRDNEGFLDLSLNKMVDPRNVKFISIVLNE